MLYNKQKDARMDLRKITDDVSVAGQITPNDLPDLMAMGFKSLICNRPDGESVGQPEYVDVEAAAKALGLETRYIPIYPGMMGDEEIIAFKAALKDLPHPVLAYCRSGARSTTLFQASQVYLP
jgi:sulfide:quinone oxidoreductase